MTVCGFSASGDGCYAWADSETYINSRVLSGHERKLGVSPGRIVGIGVGYWSVLDLFCRSVAGLGDESYAVAVVRLPSALRRAAEIKRAEMRGIDLAYEAANAFAIVGPDGEGRIRGAVFAEDLDFAPVERDAWSSPHVARAPGNAAEVLEVAKMQLGFVQIKAPGATGGKLTIARIGRERVATTVVPLLLGDERASRTVPAASGPRLAVAEADRLRRSWGM